MSKYGLQLRVKPQQKPPARPPPPKVLGFNDDDDDDDNVERDIARQAYKNRTHKDIEEQHKKTLEEDPSAFDYDGVFDQMKEQQVRPKEQDRQDRKPRYIQKLIDKAKQREREHEVIYERKLAKERTQDEHMYADKDKFITGAYKRKLAEQAKWMEAERLRELKEEKEDVTKKTDLSDFYFNLQKNVAFGAGDVDKGKSKKQPNEVMVQPPRQVSPTTTGSGSESSRMVKKQQDEIAESLSPKEKSDLPYTKPISDTSIHDQAANEQSAGNQPRPDSQKGSEDAVSAEKDLQKPDNPNASEDAVSAAAKDHHKRSQDALAAAKERFLARKKGKVQ